jgi:hypothetical protein
LSRELRAYCFDGNWAKAQYIFQAISFASKGLFFDGGFEGLDGLFIVADKYFVLEDGDRPF